MGGRPVSMVVNTDRAREEGTHWVAMYLPSYDTVYYWDSLAIDPPPSQGICNFLNNFDHIVKNKEQFQGWASDLCGHYCIVFCYFMSLGLSFDQFIALLYNHKPNTDLFVSEFVNKIVK